ncbi:FecR family protein [Chitinophaga sp. 22321]|uniref:FecR domain-containing protein n=1 Tax=Chitinophaga hostae TaxID=2831022 RepID=A0ABS5J671_9BACT|nr:FecR family protein [Chitinophaga hostae]MBS0030561.1 FecR domain-containing protein [Chitinophaga hostae]
MDLHELQQIIHKYQQGTATPTETQLVEAWLLQTTNDESAWSSPTERAATEDRILTKLRAGIGIAAPRRRSIWQHRLLRIAAMFLLCAGAGYAGYQYRYHLLDYVDPIERLTVSTGMYDIKQVILADSTVITLAPQSSLTYPRKYRGQSREVALHGKGYFNVNRHPGQPFWVHTKSIDVQVLGTSFVVNDQPQDSTAGVSVLTGKVNVRHEQLLLGVLTANKAVSFNKTNGTSRITEIDAAGEMRWVDKHLVFETTALSEVLKALAEQYNIVFQSSTNIEKGKVFTGEFTAKDSLTDILDIITISTGLKYQLLNNHTIKIYR